MNAINNLKFIWQFSFIFIKKKKKKKKKKTIFKKFSRIDGDNN